MIDRILTRIVALAWIALAVAVVYGTFDYWRFTQRIAVLSKPVEPTADQREGYAAETSAERLSAYAPLSDEEWCETTKYMAEHYGVSYPRHLTGCKP